MYDILEQVNWVGPPQLISKLAVNPNLLPSNKYLLAH